MITNIRVAEVDESLSGLGGRVLRVQRSGKGSFHTPTRPLSVRELKAKDHLGFLESIPGELGAVQIYLRGGRFEKFLQGEKFFDNIKSTLTKYADRSAAFDTYPILDVQPVDVEDVRSLRMMIELQIDIPTLSYISLPPLLTSDPVRFRSAIGEVVKRAEQYNKGVVPQLSMLDDLATFRSKLGILAEMAESGTIHIINVAYANLNKNMQKYLDIWSSREMPVIINCSTVSKGVSRSIGGVRESAPSRLQRFGFDSMTPTVKTASREFILSLQSRPKPTSVEGIGPFDWAHHPGGAILEGNLWRRLPERNVECRCKVCKGKGQLEIINTYAFDEMDEVSVFGIGYASNLHDCISMQDEYDLVRRSIRSNEMAEYDRQQVEYRRTKLIA